MAPFGLSLCVPRPQSPSVPEEGPHGNHTYLVKWFPKMEPDRYCRKRHEDHAKNLNKLKVVFVIIVVFVAFMMVL
jgi:hypothetical protein